MFTDNLKRARNQELQVFRHWSRKSYAAFASMNQEIKIACLSASYNMMTPSQEAGVSGFMYESQKGGDKCDEDDPDGEALLLLQNMICSTVRKSEGEQKKYQKQSDPFFYSSVNPTQKLIINRKKN
ncbi:hypothetical protein DWB61_02425 [Ancylomarina euxinus]|uniref:Uncharacterized protein n=1 Tax=Ancylomarina euxinus TaxID=2283627 RepID=A0A425Y646_9BACT|nr:hypothetical protein [Ancylomarina euxinus]MCZ4694141.1 hypothetical protein [Ancylomarina euxinus]MUP15807.1 hypothetical protein [Ancylomarina euxinus]RRG23989.1 hypothetical protein DWB61_02425 [Ancylomarina euxinus]